MCIFSKLDILCFNQSTYEVKEDVGYASLYLTLSSALREDITVKFRYFDLERSNSATGEQL